MTRKDYRAELQELIKAAERRDTYISYRRSVELLAEPLHLSPVHDH